MQDAEAKQKHRSVLWITAVVALGGLLFGYDQNRGAVIEYHPYGEDECSKNLKYQAGSFRSRF